MKMKMTAIEYVQVLVAEILSHVDAEMMIPWKKIMEEAIEAGQLSVWFETIGEFLQSSISADPNFNEKGLYALKSEKLRIVRNQSANVYLRSLNCICLTKGNDGRIALYHELGHAKMAEAGLTREHASMIEESMAWAFGFKIMKPSHPLKMAAFHKTRSCLYSYADLNKTDRKEVDKFVAGAARNHLLVVGEGRGRPGPVANEMRLRKAA